MPLVRGGKPFKQTVQAYGESVEELPGWGGTAD